MRCPNTSRLFHEIPQTGSKDMFGNEDPYFGAQLLSEHTLMEEFGFVPSKEFIVGNVVGDPPVEEIEEERDGLIFHRNSFDTLHQQYLLRGLCSEEVGYQPKLLKKRALQRICSKDYEKTNHPFDCQLRHDLQEMLCGLVPEQHQYQQRPQNSLHYKNHHSHGHFQQQQQQQQNVISLNAIKAEMPTTTEKDVELQFPRHSDDLYTPRLVRGKGADREGYCGLCNPGVWLKIKQSSYWYHMNFSHGICAATGRPYPEPRKIRQVLRMTTSAEQVYQIEARCDSCTEYICLAHTVEPREDERLFEDPSVRLSWWRHSQKCLSADKDATRRGKCRRTKLPNP